MSDPRHQPVAEHAHARQRRPLFRPEVVRSHYQGDSGERAATPPMVQPVALAALILSSLAGVVFICTATHVEALPVPGRLVPSLENGTLAAPLAATDLEGLAREEMQTKVEVLEPITPAGLDVELELPPSAEVRAGERVRISYVPSSAGAAATVVWARPLTEGRLAGSPGSLEPRPVRLRLEPGQGGARGTSVSMSAGAMVTVHLTARRRSLLSWLIDVVSEEVK